MLNIYQYFADIAFKMVEGTKPPPKGKKFPKEGDIPTDALQLMEAVRDHYISELESMSGECYKEEEIKQFESLYASGVLAIYTDTLPKTLESRMDLFVWDGFEYIPVQVVVDMYLCHEYDRI